MKEMTPTSTMGLSPAGAEKLRGNTATSTPAGAAWVFHGMALTIPVYPFRSNGRYPPLLEGAPGKPRGIPEQR